MNSLNSWNPKDFIQQKRIGQLKVNKYKKRKNSSIKPSNQRQGRRDDWLMHGFSPTMYFIYFACFARVLGPGDQRQNEWIILGSYERIICWPHVGGSSISLFSFLVLDEPTWWCQQNPFIGASRIQEPVIPGEVSSLITCHSPGR